MPPLDRRSSSRGFDVTQPQSRTRRSTLLSRSAVPERGVSAVALIPAAGPAPRGVPLSAYLSSISMMPLAGRPLLYWQLEALLRAGVVDAFVAVSGQTVQLQELVRRAFATFSTLKIVPLPHSPSLLATLAALLRQVPEVQDLRDRPVLVLLGDTLADIDLDLRSPLPIVYCSHVPDGDDWCTAMVTGDNVVDLIEQRRYRVDPAQLSTSLALAGVYFFPSILDVSREVDAALKGGETQLSSVLQRYIATSGLRWSLVDNWRDLGHAQPADESTARMRERAFNSLSVDLHRGTVTKTSTEAATLSDEALYLIGLPDDLKLYFPRVVNAVPSDTAPQVTLEYINYPTLAELFLFADLTPSAWDRILNSLRMALEDFGRHRRPMPTELLSGFYIGKVVARSRDPRLPQSVRDVLALPEVTVNGERLLNPLADLDDCRAKITKYAADRLATVIHGDLCFANILVSPDSGTLRLVDPRGSFGLPGLFGDPWYDYAKLCHSAYGRYDLLAQDLFVLHREAVGAYSFGDFVTTAQRDVGDRFLTFLSKAPVEVHHILFLTSLLFLSLPALHYENEERQVALILRGLQMANSVDLLERT